MKHRPSQDEWSLDQFDYELPPERIAQYPATERDTSRLLVVRRGRETLEDRTFHDLPDLLNPGDVIVVNDTRVIPARVRGRKPTGGALEILLVERLAGEGEGIGETWSCLARSSKIPAAGTRVELDGGSVADLLPGSEKGSWRIRFGPGEDVPRLLDRIGEMPLPHYIGRPDEAIDRERYQTIFSSRDGAVAAPTAGLHFSDRLCAKLDDRGVKIVAVTLHVGPGTFTPIRCADVRDHIMGRESFSVGPVVVEAVQNARRAGKKVVAVGTTSVRALESASRDGSVKSMSGTTDLYIRPGHDFVSVDAMVTNFHLPKSSLFVMIAAFINRQRVIEIYEHALDNGYRFYSYGDAMIIL